MHFTFPENDKSRVQIDLARRVGGTSTTQHVKVLNDSTLVGWMHCTPDGGGWGDGDGKVEYKLHFYARLSKPMTDYGFWSADIPEGASRHRNDVDSLPYLENIAKSEIITGKDEITGKHIGFYTEFPTVKGETVDLKVGVSFVDLEGAEKNFMAEIDGKDFTTVREEAFDIWPCENRRRHRRRKNGVLHLALSHYDRSAHHHRCRRPICGRRQEHPPR